MVTATEVELLLDKCLLPELQIEIGSDLLDASHFDGFCQLFDTNFRQIISESNAIFTGHDDNHIRRLLLILCEQSEQRVSSYIYQSHADDIRQGIQQLLHESYNLDLWTKTEMIDHLIAWYRQRITSKKWLRQLGAIHGFVTFCQIVYGKYKCQMRYVDFLVSVGTLCLEHFDYAYKQLGLHIFHLILLQADQTDLRHFNIHVLVLRQCLSNLSELDEGRTVNITPSLWLCLLNATALVCQQPSPPWTVSKWNELDDILKVLLNRIHFSRKTADRFALFEMIPLIVWLPYGDKSGRMLEHLPSSLFNCSEWKQQSNNDERRKSLVAGRWAKKLLELFLQHLSESCCTLKTVVESFPVIHRCYVACLYQLPAMAIETDLVKFMTKLPPIFLPFVRRNRNDTTLLREIDEMLCTLIEHVKRDYGDDGDSNLSKWANDLECLRTEINIA